MDCPEDQTKAWFVLQDSWERQLWDILGEQGHAMVSELTNLSEKLGNAQNQVRFAQQLVEVDLQLAVVMSFPYFVLDL